MSTWKDRFLSKSGLIAGSSEAKDALAGSSKHSRQRRRPVNYAEKKRARKAMAKAQTQKLQRRSNIQKRHRRAYKTMRAKGGGR